MNNSNDNNEEEYSSYVKDYLNKQLEKQKNTVNNYKKSHNGTLAVIIFFLVLILAAVFITFNSFITEEKATLELPTIKTFCVSSSDNLSHDVNAKFTITGDSETISNIGEKTIYNDVKTAVSQMDFSAIPADNSNEYVKNYVENYLSSKYKDIKITEIYLTDFSTDEGTKIQKDNAAEKESEENNSGQKIMDGISNWNS